MFKRSLICTDLSDSLDRLVRFVPHLAAGGLHQLVFVHSVPLWEEGQIPRVDEQRIEAGKARLSEALDEVPEGVEVKLEVPSGRPIDTIPELVARYRSEVIFTGTPIRSLLQEKVVGSTTLELAKRTLTPIAILRPQLIATYTCEELALRCQHLWRYLLIPYNGGESAKYLLDRIKESARSRPDNSLAKCMLLWVVDDGRKKVPREYRLEQATQELESAKAELEALGLEVETEVRLGNFFIELVKVAEQFDISAIAIAHAARSALLNWTAPSSANEVLRRSWFPVLFFSPQQ
ncbi:MAG: universal stress protein [Cyanobacteriota bacterium]|nr:universal stress protein [Cyanobacteriota bacterium]